MTRPCLGPLPGLADCRPGVGPVIPRSVRVRAEMAYMLRTLRCQPLPSCVFVVSAPGCAVIVTMAGMSMRLAGSVRLRAELCRSARRRAA